MSAASKALTRVRTLASRKDWAIRATTLCPSSPHASAVRGWAMFVASPSASDLAMIIFIDRTPPLWISSHRARFPPPDAIGLEGKGWINREGVGGLARNHASRRADLLSRGG